MRKIILLTILVSVPAFATVVFAGFSAGDYEDAVGKGTRDTVKSDVEQTLENARGAYDEMGKVTFEKTIPKPEDIQSAASTCLDGILNADFGFGLSLPSISKLFNQACKAINSGITAHLDAVDFELEDQFVQIGAGLGKNSAPPNRIDYNQIGSRIADNLWDDITKGNKW